MIITLTQANFSACNIGTLTTYKVKTGSVTGASVIINQENVDKTGYEVNKDIATITLDTEKYTGHNVVVVMKGETKEWYSKSTGKVSVPANTPITSNITISVSATAVVPDVPVEQYTFTINPTPATATVTLTAPGYSQSVNSITVPKNTVVTWKVSANGFTEQTGTHTVTKTESKSVSLVAISGDMYTYTVNTTPKVATVTLTAPGYSQSGNAITVPSGSGVSWTVESLGYTTQTGTETITADKSSNVTLTVANEAQPVLSLYTTTPGTTAIWTPSGGKKIGSNNNSFVGDTVGMRCYYGLKKDGYSPAGDVVQLNSVTKEIDVVMEAIPMVEIDHELSQETDMAKVNGYFIASTGAHNGYYSNFCYWTIPVTPGQRYKIETTTGQNAYPALFCSNSVDLSSTDLTAQPAGNTLPKFTIESSKKYGGPLTFGQYVVTVPDGVTTMVVNNGTASSALSSFKIYLLK